ncbi:DUF4381 domain-containing protein [Marinomonas sp.]|nr:DUF4381 domain-containing protein [Marinomonas sp.]MDB4837366.1 DUF4381 domain-containing protein [Marinomonas sp.]
MAEPALQTSLELPNKAYLLPDAIPMWPPVWWTWLVLAAVLMGILAGLIHLIRRHKKRAYRREAVGILTTVTDDMPDKAVVLLCHETIRRSLISMGRHTQAALPNSELLDTLDKQLPEKHQFSSLGEEFAHGQYRPQLELSAEQRHKVIATTRYWIRKHHA